MDDTELLTEVAAATANLKRAKARRIAAIRAARTRRLPLKDIAVAAGMTRDGVHKLLRRL